MAYLPPESACHRQQSIIQSAPAGCRALPCLSPTTTTQNFIRRFPDLLEASPRPPIDPGTIALIRPDGYVACVAKAGHIDTVEDYLEKIAIAACVDA